MGVRLRHGNQSLITPMEASRRANAEKSMSSFATIEEMKDKTKQQLMVIDDTKKRISVLLFRVLEKTLAQVY